MKINKIRRMFFKFFQEKNHKLIKSSSLIPENDKTLLFTNAGMNQFKDIFLGKIIPNKKSLVSSQYCIRTGGKHNDFKKVGYTSYHHTLFEMLGNFSFGEYFKKEAILYAWEFLTSVKWINIPPEKIWITYYYKDLETFYIWSKIINKNRLIPIYDNNNIQYNSDNFWKMGETGLCGPCTEIFYDQGKNIIGNLPGSIEKNGERYVEIWNIVFMQFNQIKKDKLIKIPVPSVDTGMGIERLAAVTENVQSSYETTGFKELIKTIQEKLPINNIDNNKISLRIISDHLRTAACLISENILPGNEGRNYVLRRIIRRALSHGYLMGIRFPFLSQLTKLLIKFMPEMSVFFNIPKKIKKIKYIVHTEEKKFYLVLKKSMEILLEEIKNTEYNNISSKKIFYLYETYGLPIDITKDICKKNNIFIDLIGLQEIIKKNKERQNKKKIKNKPLTNSEILYISKESVFDGYEKQKIYSKLIQIIKKNRLVLSASEGDKIILVLDTTPFYSESGGQISDSGQITTKKSIFCVENVKKYRNYIGHIGTVKHGTFHIKNIVKAKIDIEKRNAIQSNHTATHLLHAALKKTLEENIQQKGSLVNENYLRFDFSCTKEINKKVIHALEILINKKIQKNIPIVPIITSIKKAKKYQAIAQFTKKYKNTIRMIQIDNFSLELCGGTHHLHTGKIGYFKILNVSNIGNITKRITAITGRQAIIYIQKKEKEEKKICDILKTNSNNLYEKIKKITQNMDILKKENKILRHHEKLNVAKKIIKHAYLINNIYLITYVLSNNYKNMLKNISEIINTKLKSAIIILIHNYNLSNIFNISVTKNIVKKLNALEIMDHMLIEIKGIGGGNKVLTKGKINNPTNILHNLEKIKLWIIKKLSQKKIHNKTDNKYSP